MDHHRNIPKQNILFKNKEAPEVYKNEEQDPNLSARYFSSTVREQQTRQGKSIPDSSKSSLKKNRKSNSLPLKEMPHQCERCGRYGPNNFDRQ